LTHDGILGIQATTVGNQRNREKKIREERSENMKAWLDSGGLIQVWGWGKYKKAVDRKFWRVTITEVK
jgi:hypothetical protein